MSSQPQNPEDNDSRPERDTSQDEPDKASQDKQDNEQGKEGSALDDKGKKSNRGTSIKEEPVRWFVELLIILGIVGGFVFLLQAFIVKPFRIPSDSMYPTLDVGQ